MFAQTFDDESELMSVTNDAHSISEHLQRLLSMNETCDKLFARVGEYGLKPIRINELGNLFDTEQHINRGLRPRDIVEIYGKSATGKSLLLYIIAIHLILPKYWRLKFSTNDTEYSSLTGKRLQIGGHESEIIFFDNELHFNILTFTTLLQQTIKAILERPTADKEANNSLSNQTNEEGDIDALVLSSLSRIHVFRCGDGLEFLATLRKLHREKCHHDDDEITPNSTAKRTRIIFIDNILAYFWNDRSSETFGIHRQKQYLNTLFSLVSGSSSVLLYSKPTVFSSNNSNNNAQQTNPNELGTEFLGLQWGQWDTLPKYRISLVNNIHDLELHPSNPIYIDRALQHDAHFPQPSFVARVMTTPSGTPSPAPRLYVISNAGVLFK